MYLAMWVRGKFFSNRLCSERPFLSLQPSYCATANNNRSNGKIEEKARDIGGRGDHGATRDSRINPKKIQGYGKQHANQVGDEHNGCRG
jgi:hypothetical protein